MAMQIKSDRAFDWATGHELERKDAEIERLRALLQHADDVVIWEHTPARAGFQEEIEAALGIGHGQDRKEP
jgi:hypothetical protein